MKQLDAWKLMENTLVIFITDNGPNTGGYKKDGKSHKLYHAGLKGKGGVFEGALGFLPWQWKGVFEAGRDISKLTAHFDFFPTFMELAELNPSRLPPNTKGVRCCLFSVIHNTVGLTAICTSIPVNGNLKTM